MKSTLFCRICPMPLLMVLILSGSGVLFLAWFVVRLSYLMWKEGVALQ